MRNSWKRTENMPLCIKASLRNKSKHDLFYEYMFLCKKKHIHFGV